MPGVIDVTTFGGKTKEYHVDVDPGKLISYGVSLSQVITALSNSNANVGGNYLTIGAQSYNIRGLGLINGLADIENVMVVRKRRDADLRQDPGDGGRRLSRAIGQSRD